MYISNKNSLVDFIIYSSRALSHQYCEELVVHHIDVIEKPKLKTSWPMDTQMMNVYTKKIFILFGIGIFESHSGCVKSTYEDEVLVTYTVNKFDESSSSRSQNLNYNKHLDYVSCDFRQFEFKRISCRHMLAFFGV